MIISYILVMHYLFMFQNCFIVRQMNLCLRGFKNAIHFLPLTKHISFIYFIKGINLLFLLCPCAIRFDTTHDQHNVCMGISITFLQSQSDIPLKAPLGAPLRFPFSSNSLCNFNGNIQFVHIMICIYKSRNIIHRLFKYISCCKKIIQIPFIKIAFTAFAFLISM